MKRVAVLGAGIMGAATALRLARSGLAVTVFDAADVPLAGASRWNEGKIHLGHLYAADPSLRTAECLLPGGLAFRREVEELIDASIADAIAPDGDVYLVHRASVVSADDAARYYDAVTALAAGHPDADAYLHPITASHAERLSRAELDTMCDTAYIAAGFRVPERSVSTGLIADRLAAAVSAAPRVTLRMRTVVRSLRMGAAGLDGPLDVVTDAGVDGPYHAVVNALWEGRLAIDVAVGLPPPATWSHRYRVSLYLRTSAPVALPCVVIGTGPFGDFKNYNGRDLYLSWYPTGLVAEGSEVGPPRPPDLDAVARDALADEVITRLAAVLPAVSDLPALTASRHVAGGWVYAAGRGPLDDRQSTLHRRDRVGIQAHGRYISVDTGKYSIAPSLARAVADLLA